MSQSAVWLPTPNTVCVRVLHSAQRVQAATRARSSGQSTPASRPGDESPAAGRRDIHGAMRYSCVDTTGRFRRRSLRYTQTEGAERPYSPKITNKLIGKCRKIKMKASGTKTMYVKRTRAPGFTCLKLLKAK